MADKVLTLLGDGALRRTLGARALHRATTTFHLSALGDPGEGTEEEDE